MPDLSLAEVIDSKRQILDEWTIDMGVRFIDEDGTQLVFEALDPCIRRDQHHIHMLGDDLAQVLAVASMKHRWIQHYTAVRVFAP